MEQSDTSFGGTKVPRNFMECSMEFHGTKRYVIWRHQSSMEFHGIFHGIPWNTCVICNGALLIPWNPVELGDFLFGHPIEFHGIPCYIPWKSRVAWHWIKWQSQKSMEFHGNKWYFIWRHQTSMEYSMAFHGTCVIWNGALLIPWNPMDLGDFFMIFYLATPEFRGIPWNILWKSRVTGHKMTISKFHGIPWN